MYRTCVGKQVWPTWVKWNSNMGVVCARYLVFVNVHHLNFDPFNNIVKKYNTYPKPKSVQKWIQGHNRSILQWPSKNPGLKPYWMNCMKLVVHVHKQENILTVQEAIQMFFSTMLDIIGRGWMQLFSPGQLSTNRPRSHIGCQQLFCEQYF